MNNQLLPPGFLEATWLWMKTNIPVLYGSFAAFGMATLLTLRDGKSWLEALYAGAICLLISLGVINSLEMFGMSQDNALLIGVVIGGIGVERCLAILRAFSSMKTNVPMNEGDKQKMTATFFFSQRSERNLVGVNPALVAVARRALELSPIDFVITEGLRSRERQKQLVAAGASRTMNSRHLTGHAVDVVAFLGGNISWEWKYYEQIATAFKQAGEELGTAIEWGGDWKTLKDGPHFQLSVKDYPA